MGGRRCQNIAWCAGDAGSGWSSAIWSEDIGSIRLQAWNRLETQPWMFVFSWASLKHSHQSTVYCFDSQESCTARQLTLADFVLGIAQDWKQSRACISSACGLSHHISLSKPQVSYHKNIIFQSKNTMAAVQVKQCIRDHLQTLEGIRKKMQEEMIWTTQKYRVCSLNP